jgi:hypothetical protein
MITVAPPPMRSSTAANACHAYHHHDALKGGGCIKGGERSHLEGRRCFSRPSSVGEPAKRIDQSSEQQFTRTGVIQCSLTG